MADPPDNTPSLAKRRGRAMRGEQALANVIGKALTIDDRTVTIQEAHFAEAPVGDYVRGNDKGRNARLLEGGMPALIVRLDITEGPKILRSADDPWIILNCPLEGSVAQARVTLMALLEDFVRSHT